MQIVYHGSYCKIENPKIIEGKLPDLTEKGYEVAKTKDLKIVGKKLIDTYTKVLNEEKIK